MVSFPGTVRPQLLFSLLLRLNNPSSFYLYLILFKTHHPFQAMEWNMTSFDCSIKLKRISCHWTIEINVTKPKFLILYVCFIVRDVLLKKSNLGLSFLDILIPPLHPIPLPKKSSVHGKVTKYSVYIGLNILILICPIK